MKKKLKLRMWVKVVLSFLIGVISICLLLSITSKHTETKKVDIGEIIKLKGKAVRNDLNSVSESVKNESEEVKEVEEVEEIEEEYVEPVEETYVEPIVEVSNEYTTRMTSFYPAESSDCTGSGLCSWDFGVNENGWYTYNGKLVVATATQYLANQGWYLAPGVHTYRYYDEITLVIDGVEYQAIVLDSCGNCCKTDRVDLFVSNRESVKDTNITVVK